MQFLTLFYHLFLCYPSGACCFSSAFLTNFLYELLVRPIESLHIRKYFACSAMFNIKLKSEDYSFGQMGDMFSTVQDTKNAFILAGKRHGRKSIWEI